MGLVVSDKGKKFYNMTPGVRLIKHFFSSSPTLKQNERLFFPAAINIWGAVLRSSRRGLAGKYFFPLARERTRNLFFMFIFSHCYYNIIILIYFTLGSTSSGSAFVIAPNLGAKILSEYFTGNAPPLYILDPLL